MFSPLNHAPPGNSFAHMSFQRVFTLVSAFLLLGCRQNVAPRHVSPAENNIRVRNGSFVGQKAGAERNVGGIALCWCPPGRFLMGSPPSESGHRADEAQVEVTLSQGFWMGKHE